MATLRRLLLELWALVPVSLVVGFVGPFASYLEGDFFHRVARWLILLLGAYLLTRPILLVLDWLAHATRLPHDWVRLFGVAAASFLVAAVWSAVGFRELHELIGFAEVVPFAALCSMLVVAVAWWAERADARLRARVADLTDAPPPDVQAEEESSAGSADELLVVAEPSGARLRRRLSRNFGGPILALESEDHYLRVHGLGGSELILARLRDAIIEIDDVAGAQTHRSWWVATEAIQTYDRARRELTLVNGLTVPVARDAVSKLQRSGILNICMST